MSVYISFPEWFVTGILCIILGLVIAGVVLFMSLGVNNVQKVKRREKWDLAKHDLVILHQMSRGRRAPSIVPFAIKLETYLRMAGIAYENEFEEPFGPKEKCPWITMNSKHYSDSSLIQEFLKEYFKKDFSKHLTAEQHGIGRAFQMMFEEHFYWAFILFRWHYLPFSYLQKLSPIPYLISVMVFFYRRKYHGTAVAQGMGRHSKEDVTKMTQDDLRAFSAYLGDKKFLFGEQPTEYDCACFGTLAQVVWNFPNSSYEALVHGDLSNIREYCYRMKERFWPDWDNCLSS